MESTGVRQHPLLSALAQAVEARALPPAASGRARVAFERAALPAEDLARLTAAAGSNGLTERAGELTVADLPAAELERLAGGSAALACLTESWRHASAPPPPPRVMGIVNVTPDSFSDGGDFLDPARAIAHGLALVEQGADLLDVGGESTRPGAAGVPEETELERVLPVVRGLAAECDVPLSIDTSRSAVAAAALDAGASVVNDVTAGRRDPALLDVVAEREAQVVLMHMQGEPRTMQQAPHYDDVVREVLAHLRARAAAAWRAGIPAPRITIDPGIGFGKRLNDNLQLVRAIPELRSLGLPVLLGVSRKSFLGRLTGADSARDRLPETAAAVAVGTLHGADVLRVHDVDEMRRVVRVARALAGEEPA
jgi:dihydropteroate synthase